MTNMKNKINNKDISSKAGGIPQLGILYVVATPIGNLEDITLRALRILQEADYIACEDTRHTRKLLTHFEISSKLISYYKGKEASKSAEIIEYLLAGANVALVSDAGVPCISDPGYILVQKAAEMGVRVCPVPGPSALTSAISIVGLPSEKFLFTGFLPSKKNERIKHLRNLAGESALLVFYESPHRLLKSLTDCLEVLGNRPAAVCKELTKIYEDCQRGTLGDLVAYFKEITKVRGEYVVLITGSQGEPLPDSRDIDDLLVWYRNSGSSLKDAVAKIAADLGLSRSKVYAKALLIWD
jgi:16S rRNA (cytidine1402-2'-O)-methyltransferase